MAEQDDVPDGNATAGPAGPPGSAGATASRPDGGARAARRSTGAGRWLDRDRDRVVRAALGALVITAGFIGTWAAFSPRSFYEKFPGAGRVWVAVDGPYNEHLVRDFGDLNLAIGAVTLVALVTFARPAVIAATVGWLVYSVPHLVYHLRHLDVYDTTDQVTSILSLVLSAALPALVLAAMLRRTRPVGAGVAPGGPGSTTDQPSR